MGPLGIDGSGEDERKESAFRGPPPTPAPLSVRLTFPATTQAIVNASLELRVYATAFVSGLSDMLPALTEYAAGRERLLAIEDRGHADVSALSEEVFREIGQVIDAARTFELFLVRIPVPAMPPSLLAAHQQVCAGVSAFATEFDAALTSCRTGTVVDSQPILDRWDAVLTGFTARIQRSEEELSSQLSAAPGKLIIDV
jgi:hypothetical protein